MSEKHKDRILATTKQLSTDRGQANAFCYLVGTLSAMAEHGKPISSARLAEAVENAVKYTVEKNLDRERKAS